MDDATAGWVAGLDDVMARIVPRFGLSVAVFGGLLAQPAGFMPGLRTRLLLAAGVAFAAAASSLLLKPPARRGQPATDPAVAAMEPGGGTSADAPADRASILEVATR